jgi:hypothetical protein
VLADGGAEVIATDLAAGPGLVPLDVRDEAQVADVVRDVFTLDGALTAA